MKRIFNLYVSCLLLIAPGMITAQSGDLKLLDWRPKSQLVVKETKVLKPRYPVIDIHNHLGNLENAEQYLEEMDKAGVWKCVSLDGRSKDDFYKEHLKVSQSVSKDRFLIFFRPDFSKIDDPDFGLREAERLEGAVKMGIKGLKIAKNLGLTLKDKSGKLVPVDDPRIDPIWAKCGELGIPVAIHVSDPKAFFTPVDEFNERYDELGAHPGWSFYGDEFPSKEEILAQRNRVFARHPNTIFIGAHMGTLPEELHIVANWLDIYPNFYVDIDARISDLGRQPYTARKHFIKYQDRIVFGSDRSASEWTFRTHWRFFETQDENFKYRAGSIGMQGRWGCYGIYLPDEVLEKVYRTNSIKLHKLDA